MPTRTIALLLSCALALAACGSEPTPSATSGGSAGAGGAGGGTGAGGSAIPCDGEPIACEPLDPLWSLAISPVDEHGWASTRALAIDGERAILVGGAVEGAASLGEGVSVGGESDFDGGYVAKLDADGKPLWARSYPNFAAKGVAPVAAGNAVVIGELYGSLSLGGGTIEPKGSINVLLFGLDAQGALLVDAKTQKPWSILGKSGAGGGRLATPSITTDPSGNVVLTAEQRELVVLGEAVVDGDDGYLVAKVAPGGGPLFTRHIAVHGAGLYAPVVVGASGDIFVGGNMTIGLVIDGKTQPGRAFLTRLAGATGATLWSRLIPNEDVMLSSLAIAPSGDIVVAGDFITTVDLGGPKPLTSPGRGIFVASYAAADGAFQWARAFDAGNPKTLYTAPNVAIRPTGEIYLAGFFHDTLTLGGQVFSEKGEDDMFLAKLDAEGNPVAARAFGTDQPNRILTGALDPVTGALVTVGLSWGKTDLGGGLIGTDYLSAKWNDPVSNGIVARFTP